MVSSILPKNERKNSTLLTYYGTSSRIVFVRFLDELKIPKRHFEINWPLKTLVGSTPHTSNKLNLVFFVVSKNQLKKHWLYTEWYLCLESELETSSDKSTFFYFSVGLTQWQFFHKVWNTSLFVYYKYLRQYNLAVVYTFSTHF